MKTFIGIIMATLIVIFFTIINSNAYDNKVVVTICDVAISTPESVGQIAINSDDFQLYVASQTKTPNWVKQIAH